MSFSMWECLNSEEEGSSVPASLLKPNNFHNYRPTYNANKLFAPCSHAAGPQNDAEDVSTICGNTMLSNSTSSGCSDPLANLFSPELIGKSGDPPRPLSADDKEDPDFAWPETDDEDGEMLLGSSRVFERARATKAVSTPRDRETVRELAVRSAQTILMAQELDEPDAFECWPATDDESERAATRRSILAQSLDFNALGEKSSSSNTPAACSMRSCRASVGSCMYCGKSEHQTEQSLAKIWGDDAFGPRYTNLPTNPGKPFVRLSLDAALFDDDSPSLNLARVTLQLADEEESLQPDYPMAKLSLIAIERDDPEEDIASTAQLPSSGPDPCHAEETRLPAMSPTTRDVTLQGRYTQEQIKFTEDVPLEERTTIMMRNLPNKYTQQGLLDLFEQHGFLCGHGREYGSGKCEKADVELSSSEKAAGGHGREYGSGKGEIAHVALSRSEKAADFFYMPIDFRSKSNLGYCFLNFVCAADARDFMQQFQNFKEWTFNSRKCAEVLWSLPVQGLAGHIDRYRNSSVMHHTVPEEFKPSLWQEGVKVRFPRANEAIEAPKLRRCKKKGGRHGF